MQTGTPTVTIGRFVLYTLTKNDAEAITARRNPQPGNVGNLQGSGAAAHMAAEPQPFVGTPVNGGDICCMLVTRVNADGKGVNGKLMLDGNDIQWITEARQGTGPHTWAWPVLN
jgi:hypothetical protein